MEPTLLVGDRLFVTKYSYGYSKHSFPFSPPILKKRIFFTEPKRGDVVVFKTPIDNRTDYIKRLIGLPGDKIQFIDENLFLNNSEILKSRIPLARFGEPKEVANTVLFLCSNLSDYITGETIHVNGGMYFS